MNRELAQRVYAYLREYLDAHRVAPDAAMAYATLGLTRRQYVRVLRWLLAYRFLTRKHGEWRTARLNVRLCACGAELTPANATCETNSKGYRIVRRDCRTCIGQRQVAKHRDWSARNPGYYSRVNRRIRQQRSASA